MAVCFPVIIPTISKNKTKKIVYEIFDIRWIVNHFKCPLRDIIRGEKSVIPAKHCWAKITNP